MKDKLISYLLRVEMWPYFLTLPFAILSQLISAMILSYTVSLAESQPRLLGIIISAILIVLLYVITGTGNTLNRGFYNKWVHAAGAKLRQDLMLHMLSSREGKISRSVLLNDVQRMEELCFPGCVQLLEQSIFFLVSIIIILLQNWLIAVYLIFITLIAAGITQRARVSGTRMQEENSELQEKNLAFLRQTEEGYGTIVVYGQQNRMNHEFRGLSRRLNWVQGQVLWNRDKVTHLTMLCLLVSCSITMLVGGYFVGQSRMTLAQLMLILSLINRVFNPLQGIMNAFYSIRSNKNIVEKLQKQLSISRVWKEEKKEPAIFTKEIKVDITSFQIDGRDILKNVHFDIKKKTKTLLVGPNACGKSTLLKLILGQYPLEDGTITIDGKSYRGIREDDIAAYYAPVDQNIELLFGGVKDNITLYQEMDSGKLKYAAGLVEMEEYLYRADCKLSGGQRQRIAIARAVASQRGIVILDESFSAVDKETAQRIERRLLEDKELTIVEIAHRMSAENFMLFDQVVLMEHGTIQVIGSPQELLKNPFITRLLAQGKEDVE